MVEFHSQAIKYGHCAQVKVSVSEDMEVDLNNQPPFSRIMDTQ